MWEVFGFVFGGMFVFFLLQNLWISFKWRVLGIKPNILNEELVSRIVESYAQVTLKMNMIQAERDNQEEYTKQQEQEYLDFARKVFRAAIEAYIEGFVRES